MTSGAAGVINVIKDNFQKFKPTQDNSIFEGIIIAGQVYYYKALLVNCGEYASFLIHSYSDVVVYLAKEKNEWRHKIL